jgi:tetratricopeptide (TPR) repeat protein
MTVWASYVVTLLPVLGIIQVGAQAAADRYTYLPGIGPFLLIGLGSAYAWERTQRHSLVARGASVLLPALMIFGLLGQLTVKQIGVWKDSATLWTAAVTLFPGYERLYINRADAYARSGDYGKALEDLDKALALRPDSREAYLNRGVYHSRRGDYRSSIESYTKAIELFPQEGQFYNNRAFAYLMMRDFQQGLQDVDRAIALDPHFFAARINKCQALLSLKNYREAAEECSKAIDIKPADDRTLMAKETYLSRLDADSATSLRYDIAYYTRGVAYLGEGEKQKAMGDFDQALRLNPQFQEAYVRRGVAFGEAGKLEDAIEDFSSAIRLNPRNHDAYYNRGVIYFKEGRKQEALKDFQRAARLGNSASQEFLNSSKGTQESR